MAPPLVSLSLLLALAIAVHAGIPATCPPPPIPLEYTLNMSVFSIVNGVSSGIGNETWFYDQKGMNTRKNYYQWVNNELVPTDQVFILGPSWGSVKWTEYLFVLDANGNGSIDSCYWNNWEGGVLINVLEMSIFAGCAYQGQAVVNGIPSLHFTYYAPQNFNSTIDYYADASTGLPRRMVSTMTTPENAIAQMDFWSWSLGAPASSIYTLPKTPGKQGWDKICGPW